MRAGPDPDRAAFLDDLARCLAALAAPDRGQRIYLRDCDPAARADVLVDHREWRRPRLLRSDGASS